MMEGATGITHRAGHQVAAADAGFFEARLFLTLLDEEAEIFCFQTFDDSPAKRRELARTLHGSLEELWPTLMELNEKGAGVFVAINVLEPKKPRRNEHVTGIRAVFADFDSDAWQGARFLLPPLIEVESSPGKRHFYWPVAGLPVDRFRAVQKAIAKALGSDTSVHDPCRVLRLPGTLHQKDPDRPHLVRIIHAETVQPYPAARVLETFAVAPPATPASPPTPVERSGHTDRAHLSHARKIAFDAARRTRDDPLVSRHGEIVKMAHCLRRDQIPLTKAVGELVLDTFAAHMRPTDASGKQAPMDRPSAEKALREAYNRPSEPDRPRPGGEPRQAPVWPRSARASPGPSRGRSPTPRARRPIPSRSFPRRPGMLSWSTRHTGSSPWPC